MNLLATARKVTPYLFFLGLGVLFLFGQSLTYHVAFAVAVAKGVSTLATAGNASPAEVIASEQASGWVSQGEATSKLIMAASFYVLFSILPWLMQQLTHPAPSRWKKENYTPAFDALPDAEKFAVSSRIDLNAAIKAGAAMLAAALIH